MNPIPVIRRHLATVDSTNTFAKANARLFDAAALTVVTAGEQTEGKGRLGRVWKSGGADDIKATFAFKLPPAVLPTAYQLSPFLAVMATRALQRHGVDAKIKWPNDLLLSGSRKVGGILCELEAVDGAYWAALGVGINVNSSAEELGAAIAKRPVWPLTTVRSETGRTLDVAALTDDLVSIFAAALPLYISQGFAPFQAEYEALNVLLGKRIRFLDGSTTVEGRVVSLGLDGNLYIQLGGEGAPRAFLSGEVSSVELAPGEVIHGHHAEE